MKNKISLIGLTLAITFILSCEKKETVSDTGLCPDEYFYYSGNSKTYLKHSSLEVWIEFVKSNITSGEAGTILEKYPFIDTENIAGNTDYDRLWVKINEKCDCSDYKNLLKELNRDNEIFSATPVFYTSDNDPDSYMILLSEVLTKNNENLITESDFIDYAGTINLELIESKYSTQYFKVKEVQTGFEALEIANLIYESGKVQYSHPNFIVKIVLH